MQWFMPVIPALGRMRQEDHKFKVNLGYLVRPCLKSLKNNTLFLTIVTTLPKRSH
jgi:hypothetical protein